MIDVHVVFQMVWVWCVFISREIISRHRNTRVNNNLANVHNNKKQKKTSSVEREKYKRPEWNFTLASPIGPFALHFWMDLSYVVTSTRKTPKLIRHRENNDVKTTTCQPKRMNCNYHINIITIIIIIIYVNVNSPSSARHAFGLRVPQTQLQHLSCYINQ